MKGEENWDCALLLGVERWAMGFEGSRGKVLYVAPTIKSDLDL
jgi:hypothetical protein